MNTVGQQKSPYSRGLPPLAWPPSHYASMPLQGQAKAADAHARMGCGMLHWALSDLAG